MATIEERVADCERAIEILLGEPVHIDQEGLEVMETVRRRAAASREGRDPSTEERDPRG